MYSHDSFTQFAKLNNEHHLELLRDADHYRLLPKPNEHLKRIKLLHKVFGLFTLNLYTFRHRTR